jgi:hypothetical protein
MWRNYEVSDTAASVAILIAFMAILTVILKACGPTLIILQNPATRELVECEGEPWDNWYEAASTEACAKRYQAVGYKRWLSF